MPTFDNLRPNCLLTRYPIIFLSGRTSLFRFGSSWRDIPDWLEAHGYDVLVFKFSSNSHQKRINELKSFLELSKGDPYHFVGEKSSIKELEWLQSLNNKCVKSLTIGEAPRHSHSKYLSWAISLAENEMTC